MLYSIILYGIRLISEDFMEDIRYDGGIGLKINNIGFISVVRKKNFFFDASKGKENTLPTMIIVLHAPRKSLDSVSC